MRRRLPQGVRMYTGDDFNYAELIAGDAQGYSDALLGIFDAIAPAASAALGALAPRRRQAVPRHPRADGAAVAPHLQGADPLLQDRRGVHGLSQRPAGSFHAWSAARRARARPCILPSCSASPTRPACSPIPSCAAERMRLVHGGAGRARLMRDLSADRALLVDQLGDGESRGRSEQLVEGCARAGIPAIAPWRDIVQAVRRRAGRPASSAPRA